MEVVFGGPWGDSAEHLTGPLAEGTCARQSFMAHGKHLLAVSVYFSTYCKINKGTILVDIVDAVTGKNVATSKCDSATLKDNDWRVFPFNVVLFSNGRYEVIVRSFYCRAAMAPTAHFGKKTTNGYFFIGSKIIRDGELVCKLVYE